MSVFPGLRFAISVADESGPQSMLPIEGVRVTQLSIANELIDVTAASSGGWRHLLPGAGVRSISLVGEGLFTGSPGEVRLRVLALTGAAEMMELQLENSASLRSHFVVAALRMRGQHDEPVTYELTLESAAAVEIV